jgi:hypothetical protein
MTLSVDDTGFGDALYHAPRYNCKKAISAEEKLAVTLRFLPYPYSLAYQLPTWASAYYKAPARFSSKTFHLL